MATVWCTRFEFAAWQFALQVVLVGSTPERNPGYVAGARQQMSRNRGREQQEGDRDGNLHPHAEGRFGECDADENQSGTCNPGLRRRMHPQEEIRQPQHSQRGDETDRCAHDQKQRRDQNCHGFSSSLIDPRSMNPANATVARKPTSATPSAISMNASEPGTSTAIPVAATPSRVSISSA